MLKILKPMIIHFVVGSSHLWISSLVFMFIAMAGASPIGITLGVVIFAVVFVMASIYFPYWLSKRMAGENPKYFFMWGFSYSLPFFIWAVFMFFIDSSTFLLVIIFSTMGFVLLLASFMGGIYGRKFFKIN